MHLESFVQHGGYAVIVLLVIAESLGLPLPVETILLASAAAAGATGAWSLPGLIIAAAVGAMLGNGIDYALGRRGGRPFLAWLERQWWVRGEQIEYTAGFIQKHGNVAILLGRFIPLVRVFAALLAGVTRMDGRVFAAYTVLGSALWATIIVLIGHTFGRNLAAIDRLVHEAGFGVVAVAAVLLAGWWLWRRKQRRER